MDGICGAGSRGVLLPSTPLAVSAGRVKLFGVVSRSNVAFPQFGAISVSGSIPGSSTTKMQVRATRTTTAAPGGVATVPTTARAATPTSVAAAATAPPVSALLDSPDQILPGVGEAVEDRRCFVLTSQ